MATPVRAQSHTKVSCTHLVCQSFSLHLATPGWKGCAARPHLHGLCTADGKLFPCLISKGIEGKAVPHLLPLMVWLPVIAPPPHPFPHGFRLFLLFLFLPDPPCSHTAARPSLGPFICPPHCSGTERPLRQRQRPRREGQWARHPVGLPLPPVLQPPHTHIHTTDKH